MRPGYSSRYYHRGGRTEPPFLDTEPETPKYSPRGALCQEWFSRDSGLTDPRDPLSLYHLRQPPDHTRSPDSLDPPWKDHRARGKAGRELSPPLLALRNSESSGMQITPSQTTCRTVLSRNIDGRGRIQSIPVGGWAEHIISSTCTIGRARACSSVSSYLRFAASSLSVIQKHCDVRQLTPYHPHCADNRTSKQWVVTKR